MTKFTETARKLIQAAAEHYGPNPHEDPAKARKRARLVEAASELFIQHGYRKTSVEDVARRAGVAKGTLYLYFPAKADLLLASLFEERIRLLDSFLPLLDEEMSGRERLRLWLRQIVLMLEQSPLSVRLLGRDRELLLVLDELDQDYLEQVMDMKVGFLASLIDDACEPGQKLAPEVLRLRAKVLMATFNAAGFFTEEKLRMGLDLETFIDGLCDALLDGLCAPPRVAVTQRPASLTDVGT